MTRKEMYALWELLRQVSFRERAHNGGYDIVLQQHIPLTIDEVHGIMNVKKDLMKKLQ